MKSARRRQSGQGMVEYIIIVVIVALAAIAVYGLFGDRIRSMMGGAVVELGGDQNAVDQATQTGSADYLRSLNSGTTGGQ
jgi:type IV pilus assembly protein PilA